MFVYFQDLGEIANSDVESLMKNKIDWRSQSVENWLRHNFEERESPDRRDRRDNSKFEKINKTRQMEQFNKTNTNYSSEKDIPKFQHPPPGREKLSGHSMKNIYVYFLIWNGYLISFLSVGDKKQVSIVENVETENQNAKKKREKFKRQDTPLHPYSIRWGLRTEILQLLRNTEIL